jgi:hypothetical protein
MDATADPYVVEMNIVFGIGAIQILLLVISGMDEKLGLSFVLFCIR